MNREQLIKYIEENDLSNLLDDEVHEAKSAEATDINNEGPTAQINYLLSRSYTLDTIESWIMDDVKDDLMASDAEEEEDGIADIDPVEAAVGPDPEPESD